MMGNGFDSSVSRIQPKTKKQFFRPNINNNSIKPSDPEKIKQVTPAVLNKEKVEINKKRVPLESLNENRDRSEKFHKRKEKEEEKVEKVLPNEKTALNSRSSSREINPRTSNNSNKTVNRPIDFTDNKPENDTEKQLEETSSGFIQDRYLSLRKRLDSYTNQDPGNSVKKNKASENANIIKNVIRNYQSKIKHLTDELAVLAETHKFTRDELKMVKQDLFKKNLSLEQATKLGREKTVLSEEILEEMEIAVFERDRAFTTIAELKAANKSNEELLEKVSITMEGKEKELEEAKAREKELLQAIELKDGEINKYQLALAKRTADRDELFDRLENLTNQLEEIDKSDNALIEIKKIIDRDGKGLLE